MLFKSTSLREARHIGDVVVFKNGDLNPLASGRLDYILLLTVHPKDI